jgi:DNA-directed RNA polymerase specialized sigma24 family protein
LETDKWIEKQYTLLLQTTKNIVKNPNEVDDILHCVLEQILKKKDVLDGMADKNKLYYFIRVLKNNYFSNTSRYHYQFKKPNEKMVYEITEQLTEIPDETPNDELPDMKWVMKELENLSWFDRDLFLLWMELGSLTSISKQTKIPLNSVGRYINETKQKLKKRWENRN